jgi:hypothetical protein
LCRGGPCNQERASERIGKAHFPARGFKADAAPLAFSRLSFNIPSFSQRNAGTEPVQNPYSEYSGTRNIGIFSTLRRRTDSGARNGVPGFDLNAF